MSRRATSPVLGIVLVLVVTAVLAGAVGTAALGPTLPEEPRTAAIDLRVEADANRLTFVHRGGDALDARELSIRVRIDGTALDAQPPVPFFSARGFRPGPTGPFNSAADPEWTAGERATLRIAGTNSPSLTPGVRVTVTISVAEATIAKMEGTA